VFGGYFSSRWVENIREDKGYTYSPRSSVEHRQLGSTFRAAADVATGVTAAAVLETAYELGRMAATSVREDEVEAARQYAIGSLSLSIATQAGLASTLASLSGAGLGLDWLAGQPARVAAVTADQVTAVAAEYLAPSRLVSVIVGDAASIRAPLGLLSSVVDA
jgi:zinc protease